MKKRLVMVGKWHIIEPLGVLHLLGLAKKCGWECRVVLIDEFNYQPLFDVIRDFKPDRVDFSLWTGWHVQNFKVCDEIRRMGIQVAIGGPHATYSTEQCVSHADIVAKGDAFRIYRLLLEGKPLIVKDEKGRDLIVQDPKFPNVYFDTQRMAEGFPDPDRGLVYKTYPKLAKSPIKSIMCTEGCPFKCSYCYAPSFNKLYGGFELTLRTIDGVIQEAREIRDRWGAKMIYFQDDIFGFRIPWLREFVKRWKKEVGIPWHCQVRLELVENQPGDERLDLFAEGGCTGITLAIESGNAFMRQFVLDRPMEHELIVEGCRRIQKAGLTLRTEQILAVPLSDIETDIQTLGLNNQLNPEMAWTSILAPYIGTSMGTIARNIGSYDKQNEDLTETFFDRSVMRHIYHGIAALEEHVRRLMVNSKDNPLLRMIAEPTGPLTADIYHTKIGGVGSERIADIRYLDPEANDRYCDQTVALQRIFNWLSRVPDGHKLATRWVALPKEEWTWKTLGRLTEEHLRAKGYGEEMSAWGREFANGLNRASLAELPEQLRLNPYYFYFLPSGPEFAKKLLDEGHFQIADPLHQWNELGRKARHWLFMRALYKIDPATPPIAKVATRHQRT